VRSPVSFDVSQLEFKLIFEVKGDVAKLGRALRQLPGWSASELPYDCSHEKYNERGSEIYARINSPGLRLGNGALDEIARAMHQVEQGGGQIGKTGAMRMYVRRSVLNDAATTNLIRMHMHNEDVLYRLARHGGPGRPLNPQDGILSAVVPGVGRQRPALCKRVVGDAVRP